MESNIIMDSVVEKKNVKFLDSVESEPEKSENDDTELNNHFNKFQLLEQESEEFGDIAAESADDNDQNSDKDQQISRSSTKTKRRRRNKNKHNKNFENFKASLSVSEPENERAEENVEAPDISAYNHLKLLKLDMRNLLSDTELKRMFGKSVLKEDKSKEFKHPRHHSTLGTHRSKFVAASIETKISHFTGPIMEIDDYFQQRTTDSSDAGKKNAKVNNDRIGRKSTKIELRDTNQITYFKFVHDKSYQIAHNNFLEAAHRGHSEAIIQNLTLHPGHVESLIQLGDIVRISEDYKTASELVERALLIFERGFHQKFNIAQANCRLSYRRPENRSFFIVIFKHINNCNRRGLRRTPLEYTKLLLALDPENDPLFATLLIDFFALRSEEYDFLIEFVTKWEHLSRLPNLSFSIALAYFLKSRSAKNGKVASEDNLKIANQQLENALLRYPNFITQLLDACSAEPDAELKKCDYFDYSVYGNKYKTVPEPIELLIAIYVQRNCILWKNKHVMSWLEENMAILVSKFANGVLKDEGQQKEFWANFKGPSPRNLLRHIVLSDLSVKVPPSATNISILDIDPYPPESIISYSKNNSTSSSSNTSSSTQGISSLFIRSFLPNFSLSEPAPSRQEVNNIDTSTPQHALDRGAELDSVPNTIQNVLSSLSNLLAIIDSDPPRPDEDENHPNNGPQ